MASIQMSKSQVKELIQSCHDEGDLSKQSLQLLTIPDIGAQIQNGLGMKIDDVTASEVVLASFMPDDSGSIRFVKGNSELVMNSHNQVIEALRTSKSNAQVLAHCRYLNGKLLYPYVPLDQVVAMTSSNYSADGGTPLFDQTVVVLGTVIAKAKEFQDGGLAVRTITAILTDGNDEGSVRSRAKDVAAVVEDMLRMENHIIMGVGIADGHTDFRRVFRDMGLLDKHILTPGNSPSEFRAAMNVVSQSMSKASQSAGNFASLSAGGFGTI